MSYAAAAAKNRLPLEQQPHPDQNLLEGEHHDPADVDISHSTSSEEKVHVVTRDEFEQEIHPAITEHPEPPRFTAEDAANSTLDASAPAFKPAAAQKKDEAKGEAKKGAAEAEEKKEEVKSDLKKGAAEAEKKYEKGKEEAEKKLEKGKEEAEKKFEKGKEEAEKTFEKGKEEAKKEYELLSEKAKKAYNKMSKEAQSDWHKLSAESKKNWEKAKNSDAGQELQKPEVWGTLLGIANLAVLGTVGYYTYINWSRPRWDRRVVSATVIGVATWFGLQGYLLPQSEAVQQKTRRNN